ncbi:hypothetical protein [Phaeobacter inhibens]|uniref:hypothetical protein n=1 Tax=Phaeobacter inhibens TaxID=221822 RepID=UPI0021A3C3AF|nr:hypothetical protein [Phaeobacter inhibens]UWR59449.1 hypothetical protein K4F88_10930 [Phaeobacter inhibens]UWR79077.1 hypothetical protein K4K97_10635 [Phaeobacter inhibens]
MADGILSLEAAHCPFCYAELDPRADVCGQCHAKKDMTPVWLRRLQGVGLSLVVTVVGLFLAFVDGKGIDWWGIPFVVAGGFFLVMACKRNLPKEIWYRNE